MNMKVDKLINDENRSDYIAHVQVVFSTDETAEFRVRVPAYYRPERKGPRGPRMKRLQWPLVDVRALALKRVGMLCEELGKSHAQLKSD